jgi:hypothetical protein
MGLGNPIINLISPNIKLQNIRKFMLKHTKEKIEKGNFLQEYKL